jgi:hypothetical protein
MRVEVYVNDLDEITLTRSARLRRNLEDGDLVLLRWPDQRQERDAAALAGRARLLLLPSDAEPPRGSDTLEDWIRTPIDATELESRRAQLMRVVERARPIVLDEYGQVRRGRRWIILSPQQEHLFAPLVAEVDHVVRRSVLLDAIAVEPEDLSQRLDPAIRRLRGRIGPLGLTIRTVRGIGYALELGVPPDI